MILLYLIQILVKSVQYVALDFHFHHVITVTDQRLITCAEYAQSALLLQIKLIDCVQVFNVHAQYILLVLCLGCKNLIRFALISKVFNLSRLLMPHVTFLTCIHCGSGYAFKEVKLLCQSCQVIIAVMVKRSRCWPLPVLKL